MLRKLGIGPDPNEITKELIQTTFMKCKTKIKLLVVTTRFGIVQMFMSNWGNRCIQLKNSGPLD